MQRLELERRLRRAALTYQRTGPSIPDLERRILARIAKTPRGERGTDADAIRRSSWRVQLLATVAVLTFALAVGFLIREAQIHRKPVPVTSPSPRAGSLLVNSSMGVPPMGFTSAQEGWVVSGRGLLLTRDGGGHWRDASPKDLVGWCCTVYFLDSKRGWALGGFSTDSDFASLAIFRTLDGGNTWTQVGSETKETLPSRTSGHYQAMDFVDEQHGWLMYQYSTSNESVVGRLERTSDGGATWTQPTTLPAIPDEWNYGSLFPRVWMHFIDPLRGWYIAQAAAGESGQLLYVTHDGGLTWQIQPVPVPPADTAKDNRIGLPALLNSNLLVLPITVADGHVLLDFSQDGGNSWTIDGGRAPLFPRGIAIPGQGAEAPTFVGNGVVALVLGSQIELDVGNRWLPPIQPHGIEGAIVDIEFANAQVGWALSVHSCAPAGCSNLAYQFDLMKTTDGGRNWTRLGS